MQDGMAKLQQQITELQNQLDAEVNSKKEMQIILDAHEAELKTILKGSPNIIMSLDKAGKIININHITSEFELYDIEGKNACGEVFVDCENDVKTALAQAYSTRQTVQIETMSIIGECITRFTPVIIDNTVQKVVSISLDISSLKSKERHVQLILKHSPTIITTVDNNCRILEFNHLTTNFELYDMEGSNACDSLFYNCTETVMSALNQAITTQDVVQVDTHTLVGECVSRFVPIISAEKVLKVMIVSMDVSDIKRTEQELRAAKIELEKTNHMLEEKVQQRTLELHSALAEAEESNRTTMEGIQYAKSIQVSLLAHADQIKTYIPESFFIWMPRDIVSGDIFYIDTIQTGLVVAVIDCTGHGVPGALMTMIAFSSIKRIINDEHIYEPGKVLQRLNYLVKSTLQQDTEHALSNDQTISG